MKKLTLCLGLAALLFGCAGAFAQTTQVVSPSGKTVISVTAGDVLEYAASFDGVKVLDASKLGLTFKGADKLGALKVVDTQTEKIDSTWAQPLGKRSQYVDRCTQTTIALQETGAAARKLSLVVRSYDDGFAFRYVIPADSGFANADDEFCIESEETEFAFGKDYDAWVETFPKFNTSQEEQFLPKKLSEVRPDSIVGMPLVVKGDGFYVALTESDLFDWSGAQFAGSSDCNTTIKVRLTPRQDENGCVVRKGAASSPWRVALLGKTPVDLVNNSGIILNVATPNVLGDVSWIEPGNSSWNWWAPQDGYPTDKVMRELVDLSAEMGWRYTLVDAGWMVDKKTIENPDEPLSYTKDLNIPELVKYAEKKGVRIIVWFHYAKLIAAGEAAAFKQLADWGVAGVKIDFMDSHNQEMVQWIESTCKLAADCKLLVDYHGMYKPTGMERTYPNQITREGVRGNEYNRWSSQPATHTATLPFTRCMIGPADYTPGGFLNVHSENFRSLNAYKDRSEDCRVIGTRAHELALCMIYDSPLRCLCDLPRNCSGQPGIDYLRDLPPVWDETVALDGQIGEFYVVARRSGNDWYISGITNEEARSFAIPLDFLDEGEYAGTLYSDLPASYDDAQRISVASRSYYKGDVLSVEAVREGGWSIVLKKR